MTKFYLTNKSKNVKIYGQGQRVDPFLRAKTQNKKVSYVILIEGCGQNIPKY